MLIIAIDPGVKNGVVVYCDQRKCIIRSGEYDMWDTADMIRNNFKEIKMVLIEDARLNFRPDVSASQSYARAQGAGWIKTLCGQYEKLCRKYTLKYQMIKPSMKWTKKDIQFVKLQTGIQTKAGEQNRRDALMLLKVYGDVL